MHEKELSELCKKHDARAERMVFERYAASIRGVCYRYVNSASEAEDLLQDSFIKIFDSIQSFSWRGEGSFTAWMRRIAINTAINAHNKNKRMRLSSLDDDHDQLASHCESNTSDDNSLTETLAEAGIDTQQLLALLHALPEHYRVVFNLAVIDGLKHKDIASMMNIDESSSRSRLLRAKNMLRQSLETILKRKTIAL